MFRLKTGILLVGIFAAALSTTTAQDKLSFPYEAWTLHDNVTIRSGLGDVDYPTDKLKRGTSVTVLRHHSDGWCAIVPPKSSFSLVPAVAVHRIDDDNGVIQVQGVATWLGTHLGQVQRPQSQLKLRANQRVEILGRVSWPRPDGQATNDWYQITPPPGELRWIRMADLQLPATSQQQQEFTTKLGGISAAPLNQRVKPDFDRDFDHNEVAQANMQSVVDAFPSTGDLDVVQPSLVGPPTAAGDFTGPGNSATVFPGDAIFENSFLSSLQRQDRNDAVGTNFYSTDDDFSQGLVVEGKNAALKIGGYVKLDVIYDFNPIDSTDAFNVGSIPVNAPPRTNSRIHVRQTRLNFDTRFKTDRGIAKVFVEGDFFSEGNRFRLRHAYGELNRLLGGQTWTTFANIDAAPATLDFEGSVSSITPRRGQVRWTIPLYNDDVTLALALEDSTTEIQLLPGTSITGDTRTISPDFVARLRRTTPRGNLQVAGIARRLGFQPTGEPVESGDAWGLNFSQVAELNSDNRVYWQINYGNGIASLLGGLPDIAPTGPETFALLGYFGWMAGTTHEWNDRLSSNFTFAESHFRNTAGQPLNDINNLTYLAANLIWEPLDGTQIGIEYLYGKREDISGASGLANRIQFAVFYLLP